MIWIHAIKNQSLGIYVEVYTYCLDDFIHDSD